MVLREQPLSLRVLVLSLGGDTIETSWGANCVAVAGGRATLVIDPLIAPAQARLVAEVLARRGFPPVTHVVVTHHHTDHALGAGWFAARGVAVVAQRLCAEAMAAQHPATVATRRANPALAALFADAEPYVPSVVFDESHNIDLGGGVVVDLRHAGWAHTPGDAVIQIPAERVAVCGDIIFARYHFNYEEADRAALPSVLAALARLPVDQFIPGHGRVGGVEIVDEQRRYHETVARITASTLPCEQARAALRKAFPDYSYIAGIESAFPPPRAQRP